MPVRLLFWNVENFALNKIANPSTDTQSGSTLTQNAASLQRFAYILQHLNRVQPHIFVMVELETGYDGNGRLVRGAGLNGAATLLAAIRNLLGDHWALVPPLQTGPSEGVAVYFDSRSLVFTGPYVWPGGSGSVSIAPGTGIPSQYPPELWRFLPWPTRKIPVGAQYNAGLFENFCAAKTVFKYCAAAGNLAGNAINYNFQRSPYLTTFAELAANGTVARNLSIFGIHSPAWEWGASNYLLRLAVTADVVDGLAANEVRVIAGDFNVNLMELDLTEDAAYGTFRAASGYGQALVPVAPAPGDPKGYKGYYATHIRTVDRAKFWSTNDKPSYYPRYGYIGASPPYFNFYAIDNVFWRYGAAVNPPASNNFTVVSGIVGAPYTVQMPTYGGGPTGTIAFPRTMPSFQNPQPVAPGFDIGTFANFVGWSNYGYIRSTSDHLALAMDL